LSIANGRGRGLTMKNMKDMKGLLWLRGLGAPGLEEEEEEFYI